jgi:ribonucleoside-diphosphate reductase alpha chain
MIPYFKMKKFIVETYYTCTFKTIHALDELNDVELSKIDSRKDGSVELIEVKLNNRKTKKVGDKNKDNDKKINKTTDVKDLIGEQILKATNDN